MDLRRLVEIGLGGTQLPWIKVVAGNTLYAGYLGTAEQRRERFQRGLAEDLYNAHGPLKKAKADAALPVALDEAESITASLGAGDSTDSFALLNCQIWPASGGDGVEVACVHVPYAAVDGWWLGAQKRVSSGEGGGFFAGALFPLGGSS